MQELGVQKSIICGGGSLAPHLDDFFEALGLPVVNGWGLTETSPVLACRAMETPDEPQRNTRGTVGLPIQGTEIKCDTFCYAFSSFPGCVDICERKST
jgi:long-chain acyl-CoA synthetase